MNQKLFKGMVIFYKINKTMAKIVDLDDKYLKIELLEGHDIGKVCDFGLYQFGEWLFFDKNDIELSYSELSKKPEYIMFSNEHIREYIDSKETVEVHKSNNSINIKKDKLISFLETNYSFDGFHHYTDFKNFIKIMNRGELLCRVKAEILGFYNSANMDVIKNTQKCVKNRVRFYYKEKTPTLYDNEGIKFNNKDPHMPIPVLLLFKKDIIKIKNVGFLSGCGGSRRSEITNDIKSAMNF